jgi:hypothetical protein
MSSRRPSPRQALRNFRDYDAGFFTKMRMSLGNTWIKIRTRKDCCGNHGQPGC